MTWTRSTLSAAALVLSAASAAGAPASVTSTVNLRSGPGTGYEIVAKIPGMALVDANNCINGWCEVSWQGKTGFAIATALDLSGRAPGRAAVRQAPLPAPGAYLDDEAVVAGPPVYYGGPVYYGYYPYRYRPYGYYGYRRYWGYRGGYRRRW
jgi:uncharacterized protein YgiM (DUF1202 family)